MYTARPCAESVCVSKYLLPPHRCMQRPAVRKRSEAGEDATQIWSRGRAAIWQSPPRPRTSKAPMIPGLPPPEQPKQPGCAATILARKAATRSPATPRIRWRNAFPHSVAGKTATVRRQRDPPRALPPENRLAASTNSSQPLPGSRPSSRVLFASLQQLAHPRQLLRIDTLFFQDI